MRLQDTIQLTAKLVGCMVLNINLSHFCFGFTSWLLVDLVSRVIGPAVIESNHVASKHCLTMRHQVQFSSAMQDVQVYFDSEGAGMTSGRVVRKCV